MKRLFLILMKKLIFIFLMFVFGAKAQLPIDTTADYRYLFVTDSVGFINNEYLIRTELIKEGGIMERWCDCMRDSTNHLIYVVETPEPDRFAKFAPLQPVMQYIFQFYLGQITLDQLKQYVNDSTVPQDYKDLINTIYRVNKKKYKIVNNFCCYKK